MAPPILSLRTSYATTLLPQRLSRAREAEEILKLLQKTIADAVNAAQRTRSKRLVLIQGDAGIGKTWFLEYLHKIITTDHPQWRIANPPNDAITYNAKDFILAANPYFEFLMVLKQCDEALGTHVLGVLPTSGMATLEQVAEWASRLEDALNQRQNEPLLLFFDDLEWWVGVTEPQQETLNYLFKIVWQLLLRKAQIPCIIICAGRRPPNFKNPLLRLALTTFSLKGFPPVELVKLATHSDPLQLTPFLEQNAQGNPWIAQLLDAVLAPHPKTFNNIAPVRQNIFTHVVSDRLSPELKEVLYKLAEQTPTGFQPEINLLPKGHTTLMELIDTSFVDYHPETRRYFVAPVLAGLFK